MPSTLYKFRKFDDHGKRVVELGEVYLASVEELNDPREADVPLRYEDGTPEQVARLVRQVLVDSDSTLTEEQVQNRVVEAVSKIESLRADPTARSEFQKLMRSAIVGKVGILALSDSCEHPLMWSLYANSCKGFAVGFSTLELMRCQSAGWRSSSANVLDHVSYYSTPPRLDPYESSSEAKLQAILFSKPDVWAFEREVRLVVQGSASCGLRIPLSVIQEVIVGERASDENVRWIREAASRYLPTAAFRRVVWDHDNWRLRFEAL